MSDLERRAYTAYKRVGRSGDGRPYAPCCHGGILTVVENGVTFVEIRNSFQLLRRYRYDPVRDRLRSA